MAEKMIGVSCTNESEEKSLSLTLNCWLRQLDLIEEQTKQIDHELIQLAKQVPAYYSVRSLKGVSDKMAALFIAETRALKNVTHYKQIPEDGRDEPAAEYIRALPWS